MKRLIILFILPLLCFCSNSDRSHIIVFEKFCASVQRIDTETINSLSTESTTTMINTCIRHGIHPLCAISGRNIVSKTCKVQYYFKIIRDSIARDRLSARIWFKINDIDKLYIVEMVKSNEQWKVDLPII